MSSLTAPQPTDGSHGKIARSTGVLAGATAFSRILGLVRDLLTAQLFGTSIQAQAFVVAFRLPNVFRDLVAEGAVTSAFVPVLSWYRAKGRHDDYWRLSHVLLTRLTVALAVIAVAGWAAAPLIVRLIAPGFVPEPEKFALTVRLTRIIFPFVLLIGWWAFFMGLLNSQRRFALPALGPAIMNVCMIAACLWGARWADPPILAVAVAVLVGGGLQLAVQLPLAVRLGFTWRWRWRHPGAGEVVQLLAPRIAGSAVYQASIIVDTALASLSAVVGDGAVAALWYANRMVQLPLALFGTASAQASLPTLSEQAAHEDYAGFQRTLLKVMRMVAFIILPSAAGLIVLAGPMIRGLFERGAFTPAATLMTSQAMACYALGLLAFAHNKVLTGAFYALRETRIPVRLAAEAVVLNILLSLALMWPLKVMGLALAASLTNSLNAYRLARRMEERLGAPILRPLFAAMAPMAAAVAAMAAGCLALWHGAGLAAHPLTGLLASVSLSVAVYGGVSLALRIPECLTVLTWFQRLPNPARSASG